MNITKTLRPEWKKFVLPLIFLILFAYTISSFITIGQILDTNTPDIVTFLSDLVDEADENNLTIGEVVRRVHEHFDPLNQELSQYTGTSAPISILRTLDPAIPLPCEVSDSPYCRYYMSKEYYEGLYTLTVSRVILATAVHPDDFIQASATDFIIHAIILIIEGYIISIIILAIFRHGQKPWYKRILRR